MKADYNHITSRCFVNAPWYELKDKYLDLFLRHKIQPEIGLEGLCLYNESEDEFKKIADILHSNKLSCTLHAPFFDLAPGALDPAILKASRSKLQKAAELIKIFKPRSMVCHLNYEENKQGYKKEEWLLTAQETWQQLNRITKDHDCLLMLENTYEITPEAHEKIFTTLNSDNVRFCLDVGHLMSFAKTPWQDWLPRLSPWLGQLHLHDNDGETDQHLGLGFGSFDFKGLFQFLSKNNLRPLITLEPHSEKDLWQALDYLDTTQLLDML
ncbi:sugar phosphate isomerase/epimerase [bacterium]|nr:sugar phosphate isomerase/epimerase [bacterium]